MRKFLILLLCFISYNNSTSAQEPPTVVNNFIYYADNIYWQKVYHIDSLTAVKYFTQHDFIKQNSNHYQWHGFLYKYNENKPSEHPNPLYSECKIYFTVELKNDRYRVTISQIIFKAIATGGVHLGGGITAGAAEVMEISLKEIAYTKKGKMKWQNGENEPKQYNAALQKLFDANRTIEEIKIYECDF